MDGFDSWKLREEPLEDSPLYTHCVECCARLRNYFDEVAGRCEPCEKEEQERLQAWLDDAGASAGVDLEEAA